MFLRILYVTILVLICLVGYQVYDVYSARSEASKADADQVIGPADADLEVVLFFDYQCRYCKDLYPTLLGAVDRDRKVRLVLRLLSSEPVEESDRLARIAYAAGLQGKFMEMNSALIGNFGALGNAELEKIAADEGIDFKKLLADADTPQMREKTRSNIELARRIGIYAMPTLLLAGKIVYTPTDHMPTEADLLALFAQARGGAETPVTPAAEGAPASP